MTSFAPTSAFMPQQQVQMGGAQQPQMGGAQQPQMGGAQQPQQMYMVCFVAAAPADGTTGNAANYSVPAANGTWAMPMGGATAIAGAQGVAPHSTGGFWVQPSQGIASTASNVGYASSAEPTPVVASTNVPAASTAVAPVSRKKQPTKLVNKVLAAAPASVQKAPTATQPVPVVQPTAQPAAQPAVQPRDLSVLQQRHTEEWTGTIRALNLEAKQVSKLAKPLLRMPATDRSAGVGQSIDASSGQRVAPTQSFSQAHRVGGPRSSDSAHQSGGEANPKLNREMQAPVPVMQAPVPASQAPAPAPLQSALRQARPMPAAPAARPTPSAPAVGGAAVAPQPADQKQATASAPWRPPSGGYMARQLQKHSAVVAAAVPAKAHEPAATVVLDKPSVAQGRYLQRKQEEERRIAEAKLATEAKKKEEEAAKLLAVHEWPALGDTAKPRKGVKAAAPVASEARKEGDVQQQPELKAPWRAALEAKVPKELVMKPTLEVSGTNTREGQDENRRLSDERVSSSKLADDDSQRRPEEKVRTEVQEVAKGEEEPQQIRPTGEEAPKEEGEEETSVPSASESDEQVTQSSTSPRSGGSGTSDGDTAPAPPSAASGAASGGGKRVTVRGQRCAGDNAEPRRPLPPASHKEEVRRTVQSLLNKICPENIGSISVQIAEAGVSNVDELELVISLIMKKALTEPHYCETYADLVYKLKSAMGEFVAREGSKPLGLKAALLNVCQSEFESMSRDDLRLSEDGKAATDMRELTLLRIEKKRQYTALMRFIGNLFLRELLTPKIISSIVQDLAKCDNADAYPEEHSVECLCELLTSIGYTLEQMPVGQAALKQVCGRLVDVKQRRNEEGKALYSKRIQFVILELLETRSAGWTKKVFKTAAKTKDEIRNQQRRDERAQAAGQGVVCAEQIVCGQRPAYLDGANSTAVETATTSKKALPVL